MTFSPSSEKWLCRLLTALLVLTTAVFAAPAQADLLVLQSGYSGHGPGLVSRIDLATGAARPPLLPMNEGCQAMCAGADGSIFVTANVLGYGIVYRYDAAGGLLGQCADLAGTQFEAAAADANGQLYLVAASYHEDGTTTRAILRGSTEPGAQPVEFIAPGTGGMFAPVALTIGADGFLYVADLAAGVLRFDLGTGAFAGVFIKLGQQGMRDLTALTFGPDGRLYVGTADAHAVLRFDAAGAFVDSFVTAAPGAPVGVRALAFNPDGDLFALAATEHQILRYDGRSGAGLGPVAVGPTWQRPSAIAFAAPDYGSPVRRAVPQLDDEIGRSRVE